MGKLKNDANYKNEKAGKSADFSATTYFSVVARLTGACTFVIKSVFRWFFGVFCCRHKFCVAQQSSPKRARLIQKLLETLIFVVHLKCQLNFFHKLRIISECSKKHFFVPFEHERRNKLEKTSDK